MAKKNETPTVQNQDTSLREFKVIEVKEVQTKAGLKFLAYKTIGKNGKKMDIRFTRTCSNVPTEPCTIVVRACDANVDTTRIYPILWVKDVQEIKPTERKNNIDEYFDNPFDEVEEF